MSYQRTTRRTNDPDGGEPAGAGRAPIRALSTALLGLNLLLRFLLELTALAALGYWGATASAGLLTRIVLGFTAPVAAGAVWGTFVAPRAPVTPPAWVRVALALGVFASAGAAMAARGHCIAGAIFVAVAVLNAIMLLAAGQARPTPRSGWHSAGG